MAISEEGLKLGHGYRAGWLGITVSCHKCNEENGLINMECKYDDMGEEEE